MRKNKLQMFLYSAGVTGFRLGLWFVIGALLMAGNVWLLKYFTTTQLGYGGLILAAAGFLVVWAFEFRTFLDTRRRLAREFEIDRMSRTERHLRDRVKLMIETLKADIEG